MPCTVAYTLCALGDAVVRAVVGVSAVPGRRGLDREGVVAPVVLRRAPGVLGVAAMVVLRRAATSAAASSATSATDVGCAVAGPGSLAVGASVGHLLCVRPVVVMPVMLVVAVGVAAGVSAVALDGDAEVDEYAGECVGEVDGGDNGDPSVWASDVRARGLGVVSAVASCPSGRGLVVSRFGVAAGAAAPLSSRGPVTVVFGGGGRGRLLRAGGLERETRGSGAVGAAVAAPGSCAAGAAEGAAPRRARVSVRRASSAAFAAASARRRRIFSERVSRGASCAVSEVPAVTTSASFSRARLIRCVRVSRGDMVHVVRRRGVGCWRVGGARGALRVWRWRQRQYRRRRRSGRVFFPAQRR